MLCSGNYVDRGPVIIHGLQDQDGRNESTDILELFFIAAQLSPN